MELHHNVSDRSLLQQPQQPQEGTDPTCDQIEAMYYYTQDGADYINDYLRNGSVSNVGEEDIAYFQNVIDKLDSAMTTLPNEIQVVYRCLPEPPQFGTQPNFLSTSTSLDIASQYGDHTLIIKIDPGIKGIDCRNLYKKHSEQEIILQRGCDLQVVSQSSINDRWYECRIVNH